MNRDKQACVNMRTIFNYWQEHGTRHPAFEYAGRVRVDVNENVLVEQPNDAVLTMLN